MDASGAAGMIALAAVTEPDPAAVAAARAAAPLVARARTHRPPSRRRPPRRPRLPSPNPRLCRRRHRRGFGDGRRGRRGGRLLLGGL